LTNDITLRAIGEPNVRSDRSNTAIIFEMLPSTSKKVRKVLRIVLHAGASLISLGTGSVAAGLLYNEESIPKAILLFLVALVGALGSIFFFFRCLRHISSKPKGPFIATLP
jgi:hypothetical protein